MSYLSIDYLIVYAFLAITLAIGLRAGRGIKDMREYAVANKAFGTGALVLTYLATNIAGASVFNGIAYMFSQGIIILLALFGLSIAFLIRGLFIAPKAAYFTNCLTMGDLMETFYGAKSKIIAGALGFLTAISLAGMELILLGFIGEQVLSIRAEWTIVVGGLLLAIYSAHGGIKSVAATDVFQFLVLIVVLPTIAYIVLGKAGGIQAVFTQVPADRLKVFSHENFSFYLTLFFMWGFLQTGLIDPALIQRLLMGKNSRQLRNQFLVIAGFDPAFQLMLLFIAFSALVIYPQLEAQQVLPHLIHTLLPVGLKGLAIAGLLAVSISSIDSYLHAAGLTFIHDFIKPLTEKRYSINELRWTRYATVGISLIAIVIALKTNNTFGLMLNALAFTGPLLMFPLLSGIMGLKTDKRSFYVALVATLITFSLFRLFLPAIQSHFITLFSILANGIAFFGMHILQNEGFAMIRSINLTLEVNTIWQPRQQTIVNRLKKLMPTPSSIVEYSRQKVAQYGAPYVLFGVFLAINYALPLFMWTHTLPQNFHLLLILRLIGGLLCGLLIVQEKWPQWLLPYMPTFWHLTVLYCLPFTNTILLLITAGSIEGLASVATSILFLIVVVDWMSLIILTALGAACACLLVYQLMGPVTLDLDFSSQYLLVYQLIFITLIGLFFARRKPQLDSANPTTDILTGSVLEEQMEFTIQATNRLANHIAFYLRNTRNIWDQSSTDGFYTVIAHGIQTIEDPVLYKLLKQLSPTLLAVSERSEEAMQLLSTSMQSRTMAANLHLVSIKSCVKDAVFKFQISYPTYECMIYQLVYTEPIKPVLKVVSLRPNKDYLLIRDYSELFSREEILPLMRGIASREGQAHVGHNKVLLEVVDTRIKTTSWGYQEYKLPFPSMEIAA